MNNISEAEMNCAKQLTRQVTAPTEAKNPIGDIFGGWLLSHMDIAGGRRAYDVANGRAVTVAVDKMTFKKPVYAGDELNIFTQVDSVGHTSVGIHIIVEVEREGKTIEVADGIFTFVAINKDKRPRPVNED